MYTVRLTSLIEKMKLENCTPDVATDNVFITQTDVNRPALQLVGFYDYFDSDRIQIIGNVEYAYLLQQGKEKSIEIMKTLLEHKVPCIVFCRNIEIESEIIEAATQRKVPILRTSETTSAFMSEVIRWLKVELAPRESVQGVLVDVYGEGVLIMGESGLGKSEAALELTKRGHRLVSDDVVIIKKVSDDTLIGTAPDITRHFMELKGTGIIDIKSLFGVGSVKNTQVINVVIMLEEWKKEQDYDRIGLEERYIEFLGNKVVCHKIPIRPGRNLAIIVEAAAVNYRQKKMGYNAAKELYNRVTSNIGKSHD